MNIQFCKILLFLALLTSCKQKSTPGQSIQELTTSVGSYVFLDSTAAAKDILIDKHDGFFEKMTALDVAIQTKNTLGFDDRISAVEAYKRHLETEVSDFTEEEKIFMDETFEIVTKALEGVSKNLIPDNLKLVKIKNGHYGDDVYYTRENTIFIPANTLQKKDAKVQAKVMLHEIWHILSRTNRQLRKESYALIGFEPVGHDLTVESSLQTRLLTNPDGAPWDYFIKLGDVMAVPLVYSGRSSFNPAMSSFFDYLQFDLFEVEDNQIKDKVVDPENSQIFFEKIKDNTQYIIHPDEILADNFMLALTAKMDNDFEQFSTSGKPLIDDMLTLLSAF